MVRRPTANRVVRENRAWGFESPSLRQICSLLCCFGVDGTIFFNEENSTGILCLPDGLGTSRLRSGALCWVRETCFCGRCGRDSYRFSQKPYVGRSAKRRNLTDPASVPDEGTSPHHSLRQTKRFNQLSSLKKMPPHRLIRNINRRNCI